MFIVEQPTLVNEYFLYACNCLSIMRAVIEANPDSMQLLMLPLVKSMQRVAKDHNQNPQAGILLAKVSMPREVPSELEHGSGSWFMYHALNGNMLNIGQSLCLLLYCAFLTLAYFVLQLLCLPHFSFQLIIASCSCQPWSC